MKIRLAAELQIDSIVDGEGIRSVIWFQGCAHKCPGCHNPETHDFKGGFLKDVDEIIEELKSIHNVSDEWFDERTNLNGGAIAIGHPLGASGARITTTLIHEMKKRELTYGLASLCIGGGMGTAVIVKAV